jgi:prepilin-type N-terminal cleavage/methylation domain-containing protein
MRVLQEKTTSNPRRHPRDGFTLLEILLALAVSVVLLVAIATAIDLYRRMTIAGQDQIGEARLVRAVLHKIEADIRSIVPPQSQVTSPYDSGSGSSSGATSVGSSGSGKGTTSNSGSSSSSTSGSSSGSSSSSSSSTGTTSTSQQTSMMDPLQNVYAQTVFGLYGDPKTLVLNTLSARKPSAQTGDPNSQSTSAIHGDLKTVAYFVSNGQISAAPGVPTTGLARVEGDHMAIGYAMMQSTASLAGQARIIAPEIMMISFRYFDGTQWQTTWDASFMQALPKAVEVTISVRAADPDKPNAATDPSASATLRQYRHVVAVSTSAQPMSISELATIPTGTPP